MRFVTWNIQAGKGCDGMIDLAWIVAVARSLADHQPMLVEMAG